MLSIFLEKSLVNWSLIWLVLMESSVMQKVYVIREHVMLLEWQILAWPFVVKIPAPNVRTIQKHMKNISVNFGKAKATVNRTSIDLTTTHTLASWQKIVQKPVDFVQKNNKLRFSKTLILWSSIRLLLILRRYFETIPDDQRTMQTD